MRYDPERDRKGEVITINSGILQKIFGKDFEQTDQKTDSEGGVDILSKDGTVAAYDRWRFKDRLGRVQEDVTFNVYERDDVVNKEYGALKKAIRNSLKYEYYVAVLTRSTGDTRLRWDDPNGEIIDRYVIDLKAFFQAIIASGRPLRDFGFDDRHASKANPFIFLPKSAWEPYIIGYEQVQ